MHNIATIGGQAAMAYADERPWHGLGVKLPGLMTPEQALIASSCDWLVQKLPLAVYPGGKLSHWNGISVANTFCTGRVGPETMPDGSPLFVPFSGSVSERYTIVQNIDAFSFLEGALGKDIAYIETVGALGKGETVWAMAKLPDDFEIVKDDPIERYILVTNSHDGSGTLRAIFSPIRVVCQNTLSAALAQASNVVSLRHTKSITGKVQMLDTLLNASAEYWERLKASFNDLMMRNMTQLEVIEFLETMFPGKREVVAGKSIVKVSTKTQNRRDAIMALYNGMAQGSAFAGQTHYGMYNAFTEWLDGNSKHSTLKRSLRGESNHWETSTFGNGIKIRQLAFDTLAKMAAV